MRPTFNKIRGTLKFLPVEIGDNVYIDKGSVIQAQSIGSNVIIGKNVIIG